MASKLNECVCGGTAKFRSSQIAEDYVNSWVECSSCGLMTDACEDNFADKETPAALWNAGKATFPPGFLNTAR